MIRQGSKIDTSLSLSTPPSLSLPLSLSCFLITYDTRAPVTAREVGVMARGHRNTPGAEDVSRPSLFSQARPK